MSASMFRARFGGVCDRCDRSIHVGETIGYPMGGGYPVHARCLHLDDDDGGDPTVLRSRETACPACHLTHRGECS